MDVREWLRNPPQHGSPAPSGYNGLAQETTAGRRDMREQLEFGLERSAANWAPADPPYVRLHGPNQWPQLVDDKGERGK